jgi:hypothetical protein
VVTAFDAADTFGPTYQYYDAAHGYGSVQTATAAGAALSGTGAGQTAVFAVTAGRLVVGVTGDAPSGGATMGEIIYEAA